MSFNIKWTLIKLYHDKDKSPFDEVMMFVKFNTLNSWILISCVTSLKQQSSSSHIIPTPRQLVCMLLIKSACLSEKQENTLL